MKYSCRIIWISENEDIWMRGKFVEQSIGELQTKSKCIPDKLKNSSLPLSEALSPSGSANKSSRA